MSIRVNYVSGGSYTVTLGGVAEKLVERIGAKSKVFFSSGVVRMCLLRGLEILSEECGLKDSESEVQSGVGEKTGSENTH